MKYMVFRIFRATGVMPNILPKANQFVLKPKSIGFDEAAAIAIAGVTA